MFFEPSPTKFTLPQPTNSLSELLGDPNYCGPLEYKILDADSLTEVAWMHIDE